MLSAAEMSNLSFLLDEVIPLDAAARRRWIERLPTEHQRLTALLRHHLLPQTATGSVPLGLDTLPKLVPGPDDQPGATSALKPNEDVGPYRLVRQLGAGGMAVVWLAQRADGAFTREVALKLPLLSPLRPDLLQRFAQERDILAGLEHINIARMYDAGVRSDGLPYLVMEYVRGEALIDWCDTRRLGLRERIELFLQVLDAVQYAHAHHVIHLDLKPSNILVTQDGQVRLLDFGVARRLADPDPHRTPPTRLYGKALTPDYACPELLRGESGDAASDVYSLGVVLYQLLSGRRPYETEAGASVTQLEHQFSTVRIGRPSTHLALRAGHARATTQRRLARRLSGDLDAIVLKALSAERRERYTSVSALADDLWHHLTGKSTQARPKRLICRAGTFALRCRTGAAATLTVLAAAAFLALVSGPTVLSPDAAASTVRASDRSIAVLPFVDMSEKKDLAYFANGTAEEIRDLLSSVPELHVAARTASSRLKDERSSTADVSRTGVAQVLEGSVRRSGGRLRVSAQLVRADSGYLVWSETHDRDLDDTFKVQEQIASAVVKAVRASLLAERAPRDSAGVTEPKSTGKDAGSVLRSVLGTENTSLPPAVVTSIPVIPVSGGRIWRM